MRKNGIQTMNWYVVILETVHKEIEDYELQKIAEDPFRIEREEDLTKEQEEYFRRIRQAWRDPGSSE